MGSMLVMGTLDKGWCVFCVGSRRLAQDFINILRFFSQCKTYNFFYLLVYWTFWIFIISYMSTLYVISFSSSPTPKASPPKKTHTQLPWLPGTFYICFITILAIFESWCLPEAETTGSVALKGHFIAHALVWLTFSMRGYFCLLLFLNLAK